jgi:hypothetical protein
MAHNQLDAPTFVAAVRHGVGSVETAWFVMAAISADEYLTADSTETSCPNRLR